MYICMNIIIEKIAHKKDVGIAKINVTPEKYFK